MDNKTKIQGLSAILQYSSYVVVITACVLASYISWMVWLDPEQILPIIVAEDTVARISEASPIRAIPAWLIFLMPTALLTYGFWRLSRLFGLFRKGTYFSEACVGHLFVFASIAFMVQLFGGALVGIADYLVVIGTPDKPYGMPLPHIDGMEVPHLIGWGTFMIVSWIMREGVKLAEENAEFV